MMTWLLWTLGGCGAHWVPADRDTGAPLADLDEDGYADAAAGGADCDDMDPSINPAGTEICNGLDDDCDGLIDGEDGDLQPIEWAADADGDGYGDPGAVTSSCEAPPGSVLAGGQPDCDDTDPAINPGVREVCDELDVDEDCDGLRDDADSSVLEASRLSWYGDADGDGYGDPGVQVRACDQPEGYVAPGIYVDCDDTDPEALACLSLDSGARLEGAESAGELGAAVAAAGDVDGDGVGDALVGAPGGIGGAWLINGPFAGALTAGAVLFGDYDAAGGAVAGAGDLDGDGLDDLLVGAWRAGDYAGAVTVLYGPVADGALADAADWRDGASAGDLLGLSVAGAGDVDGDGLGDVLVGAPEQGDGGAAWLLSGPVVGAAGVAVGEGAAVLSGAGGERLGEAVAGVGDVDGDGLADVLVGAPAGGEDLAGVLYLLLGPVSGEVVGADADALWSGDERFGRAGAAAACGGDIDGDGRPDLLVGQPRVEDASPGVVWVVTDARAGGALADGAAGRVSGSGEDEAWRSAGAGDIDGDGFGELIVGAPGRERGGVAVIYGPVSGAVALAAVSPIAVGEAAGDRLGESVAALGDADGDGVHELLLGAPGADAGGEDAGAVYVLPWVQ